MTRHFRSWSASKGSRLRVNCQGLSSNRAKLCSSPSSVRPYSLNSAPALLISTSMGLPCASRRADSASTWAIRLRSASSMFMSRRPVSASMVSSKAALFFGSLITRVRSAPASARATLVASPRPLLAPVTTTCWPSRYWLTGCRWGRLRLKPQRENMAIPGTTQRSARSEHAEMAGAAGFSLRAFLSPARLSAPMARIPASSWPSSRSRPQR